MSIVNFNSTTPAAPGGNTNVVFQSDSSGNVSAYYAGGASSLCLSGAIGSLPAAGTAGRIYLPTDSIYDVLRDNGASWDYFYRGQLVTPPGGITWAWLNQGSATATQQTNGVLELAAPSNGAADNVRGYEFSIVGSSWSYIFRFRLMVPNQEYNQGGIYLRESGTGKIVVLCLIGASALSSLTTLPALSTDKLNSASSYNSNYSRVMALIALMGSDCVVFKVQLSGSTLTYSFSTDNGISWFVLTSTSKTDFFTTAPDKVGIYLNPNNQSGTAASSLTLISVN